MLTGKRLAITDQVQVFVERRLRWKIPSVFCDPFSSGFRSRQGSPFLFQYFPLVMTDLANLFNHS